VISLRWINRGSGPLGCRKFHESGTGPGTHAIFGPLPPQATPVSAIYTGNRTVYLNYRAGAGRSAGVGDSM
jgi:hypothetical protein